MCGCSNWRFCPMCGKPLQQQTSQPYVGPVWPITVPTVWPTITTVGNGMGFANAVVTFTSPNLAGSGDGI